MVLLLLLLLLLCTVAGGRPGPPPFATSNLFTEFIIIIFFCVPVFSFIFFHFLSSFSRTVPACLLRSGWPHCSTGEILRLVYAVFPPSNEVNRVPLGLTVVFFLIWYWLIRLIYIWFHWALPLQEYFCDERVFIQF